MEGESQKRDIGAAQSNYMAQNLPLYVFDHVLQLRRANTSDMDSLSPDAADPILFMIIIFFGFFSLPYSDNALNSIYTTACTQIYIYIYKDICCRRSAESKTMIEREDRFYCGTRRRRRRRRKT